MDRKYLNYKLQDGPGKNGGISFEGETLENFLEETGMSIEASAEEINKALVECGILPIFEFSWDMSKKKYFIISTKLSKMVDEYIGHIHVGDICIDIIVRDYGNEKEMLAYSFDLYVYGEDTGYGYKDDKSGNRIPYDYAEGCDIFDSDLPISFEKFKEMAEKLIARYIVVNDTKFGGKNPYSLVGKASESIRIW